MIWLPLFFLFFWLYNYYNIQKLWDYMYKDTELGSNFKNLTPDFETGKNLLAFSFFYTAVIYFGFKLRHDSVNYDYTRGLLYLYFMYAVGTVHMAFAFSYILSAY